MENRTKIVTATPGNFPSITDPLGAGFSHTVATFDWTSRNPISFDFQIQGTGGLGGYTAPAVVIIEHYDPFSNAIIRETRVVGGSQGPSNFTIATGGSLDGSVLGTGQVKISVHNLGGLPIASFGSDKIGLIGKILNLAGNVIDAIEAFSTNSGYVITDIGGGPIDNIDRAFVDEYLKSLDDRIVVQRLGDPPSRCFLAGTPVSMWGAADKPIESIQPGDVVMSYDQDGKLVPGRVKRLFRNTARHILDLHGTMVTPGHAFLCGDGPFKGRHVPIIDILRSDGAIVMLDGTLIRASTGYVVGSADDAMVWAVTGPRREDGMVAVAEKGFIRAGQRLTLESGRDVTVLDLVKLRGCTLTEHGLLLKDGCEAGPFYWSRGNALPRPEDYVLQRSGCSLEEIYDANEWSDFPPVLPPPLGTRSPANVQSASSTVSDQPDGNRHARRAAAALARRASDTHGLHS